MTRVKPIVTTERNFKNLKYSTRPRGVRKRRRGRKRKKKEMGKYTKLILE